MTSDRVTNTPDLVERLRKDATEAVDWNGPLMAAWDNWRAAIAGGDCGSWPRDAFESWMDRYAENMRDAANELERLRAPPPQTQGERDRGCNSDDGIVPAPTSSGKTES